MTATYPRANYATIGAVGIAIGIVVISFSSFGFLRATVFSQSPTVQEEIKPPPGIYERSQPEAESFVPATPQPTIAVDPGYSEYPVPTATGEPYQYSDVPETNQSLPGCTAELDAAGRIIPGTEQCTGGWTIQPDTYSNPSQQTGFRSGNGANVGKVAINSKSGYYTSNGLGKSRKTNVAKLLPTPTPDLWEKLSTANPPETEMNSGLNFIGKVSVLLGILMLVVLLASAVVRVLRGK